MSHEGKSFNVCQCGQVMKIIKTRKYDECRIRIYECSRCKLRRRSVESFRGKKGEQNQ